MSTTERQTPWPCAVLVAFLLTWACAARAYFVGLPLSLEKLTAEADVIFKGTARATAPIQDAWFKPCPGFAAYETQFTVVSVIKGAPPGTTLRFRHYDTSPGSRACDMMPQSYRFENRRSYIVFAKFTGEPGICRQLWMNHTGKRDQGALLCADNQPVTATAVLEALGDELMRMLEAADTGNVTYAIRQLDEMSGGRDRFSGTQDFDVAEVLDAIHGLMTHADAKIAQAAIAVIGSHNPYMSDERTELWLATVGSAQVNIDGKMSRATDNAGGELYWKDVVAIADGKRPAATRAIAIRALGLVREPALREPINRWLADPEAAVRAAATVLLADFPGADTNRQLRVLAGDAEPIVRASVAQAIGVSQQKELLDVLAGLLGDQSSAVRRVASTCLRSFGPKDEAVARVFRAQLGKREFAPLFLNALAREDPEPYLDALAQVLEDRIEPTNWGGGEDPMFMSWTLVFRYVQAQPPETLRSGKLDRCLDALEKGGDGSFSRPGDIYALYLLSGTPERAKKFREKAKKAASYDMDHLFKQVDQNPALYRRQ